MNDMNVAIENLIEVIKEDYAAGKWRPEMIENFNNGIEVEEGRKYIKIITRNSVWGFIMKEDDKKFRKGDILKAAGWAAPARNAARGNILDGGYVVRWTGPLYL